MSQENEVAIVEPAVIESPAPEAPAESGIDIEKVSAELAKELGGTEEPKEEKTEKEAKPATPKKDEPAAAKPADPKAATKADPAKPADPKATDPAVTKPTDPAAPATKPDPAAVYKDLPEELKTWRPEAAAKFKSLDPVVQTEILKRERDIRQGFEQVKEIASIGKNFNQVIAPFLPAMKHYGVDPLKNVQSVLQIQHVLGFGQPQQKVELLRSLAQQFNIPITELSKPAAPVDPTVAALQQNQQQLSSQLTEIQTRELEQRKQATLDAIKKFGEDPAHQYFDEVADIVYDLLDKGVARTLQDAYDKAVKLSPVVQEKERQRVIAEALEKDRKEKADAAAAAAAAQAASVRTRAKPQSSASTPVGTLDETLAETMREIRARG